MMFEIICVGDVAVDDIYSVSRIPAPDEKVNARYLGRFIGGTTCNTARALKSLGTKVLFVTQIGDDEKGRFVRDYFEKVQLPASFIHNEKGMTAATQVLLADDGEKAILLFNDRADKKEIPPLKIPAENITPVRAVFSSLWLPVQESLLAYQSPLVVSLEMSVLNNNPGAFRWAANHAHTVILDRYSFRYLFGREVSEENLVEGMKVFDNQPQQVIITRGSQGALAYVCKEGKIVHCDGYPVQAVDTTGAGDIFNAAFSQYYFLQQLNLSAALDYACAIASASCEGRGTELTSTMIERGLKLYKQRKEVKAG